MRAGAAARHLALGAAVLAAIGASWPAFAFSLTALLPPEMLEARGWLLGVRIGLVGAVAAYLLARWTLVRDAGAMSLLGLLGTVLAFDMAAQDQIALLKIPDFAHLGRLSLFVGVLVPVSAIFFARRYMRLERLRPRLNAALRGVEAILGAAGAVAAIVVPELAAPVLLAIWLGVSGLGFVVLAALAVRGVRRAELVLVAWLPVVGGALFAQSTGGAASGSGLLVAALADGGLIFGLLYYTLLVRIDSGAALRMGSQGRVSDLASDRSETATLSWDMRGDRITYSKGARQLLGLEPSLAEQTTEEGTGSWFERLHPADRELVVAAIENARARRREVFSLDFRIADEGGRGWRWLRFEGRTFIGPDREAARCVATVEDVTLEKQAEERRIRDLVRDPVTGLSSRAVFLQRLQRLTERVEDTPAGEAAAAFTVLLLDIDRFHALNDSLGPEGGDAVLAGVAARMEDILGGGALCARYGDDRIVALMPDIRHEGEVQGLAEAISAAIARPYAIGRREISVTAGISALIVGRAPGDVADLMADLETVLLRGKLSGPGAIVVERRADAAPAADAGRPDQNLRRALERDELELHYQPIFRAADGTLAGFESLLRWRHPERGLMSPGSFITLAEETGLIGDIGRYVLFEAARQLAAWQGRKGIGSDEPLFVSVNVSSLQLLGRGLVTDVRDALRRHALEPGTLKLELTESQVLTDPHGAARLLEEIRNLGAGLALDDFGTGYASLATLKRLPFDTVKIDRSFVAGLAKGEDSARAIVRAVVDLAHDLNLAVVAEGAEDAESARMLRDYGCDYVQGYAVGRPVPAHEAERFLTADPRRALA
ncbi:putative bifunctional diguanylate cyclase/phosphodiesterase [Futiania mangrovi]|uniref:EAL domain-containing protein n=1 Tax=Futiania mangrovi TaxID=2959716 RepID=A0A9J6PFV8_9PROT|nr:EAL domain-containing protein [Futiania mangrovii]MCP1337601.1 EAL domain-containing protein [Futiania mangrovii]